VGCDMILDHLHIFPSSDEPALLPFTRAFVRMMFAHAEFERRISDLMGAIAVDWRFGERPENVWSAAKRPQRMKKLITEHEDKHVGGIPQVEDIVACMKQAIEPAIPATCLPIAIGGHSTFKPK